MQDTLVPYLQKLIKTDDDLTAQDISDALNLILHSSSVPDVQISGFLVGARVSARDHDVDFICTAVTTLASKAEKIDYSKLNSNAGYVDIVGTGGDGKNTFNVSTTAAIVVAGMGVAVAKHGGPASTSKSGASDLLVALGADISKVTPHSAHKILNNCQFSYMSGPVFHPILSRTKKIRREMGTPCIFNIVGPLLNPAPIRAQVIGVYSEILGPVFAKVIMELRKTSRYPQGSAMIVWGEEGLDEVSPAGRTKYWWLNQDTITEGYLEPGMFGLPAHELSEVASGTPAENAAIVVKLFENELPENHPILDYVLLNAAVLAVVAGKASDWKDGVNLARQSITSGAAKTALATFRKNVHNIDIL